jgi:hypothetical protein
MGIWCGRTLDRPLASTTAKQSIDVAPHHRLQYLTMKFTFAITALIATSATAFAPNTGVVTSRAVSSSSSSSALE